MTENQEQGGHAVVTGASRGIGREIALALARTGLGVGIGGRDADAVQDARRAIDALGVPSRALVGDLADAAAVGALAAAHVDAWGAPDVLVANAGGSTVPPGPIEEIAAEDWRAVIDGNLTATFLTIAAFLPAMKAAGRGSIVTMSSLAARAPHVGSPAPYGAAKAGIESLTRSLAVQAGPHGIRVNAVAPGTILTEANRDRIPDAVKEDLTAQHPLGRLGAVGDVAGAVRWLASQDAAWVTGQVIDVTGGR